MSPGDAPGWRYRVYLREGCHGDVDPPLVSRHRTLAAALDRARQSDRLVAVDMLTGERWAIPVLGNDQLGTGAYGDGLTRTQARRLGWPL